MLSPSPEPEEGLDDAIDHYDEGTPPIPDMAMSDAEVEAAPFEYSIRGPADWVISGPLGVLGSGPGRRFISITQAEAWVTEKYGSRAKWRIAEATLFGGNRWAWLIKGVA